MITDLFQGFSNLLSVTADDQTLVQHLQDLAVLRRPMIPDFFKSPYEVPFRLSKHGLMLTFQETNYFRNAPAQLRGRGKLLLRSVVATSGVQQNTLAYTGELPFSLSWGDPFPVVRTKMATASSQAGILHGGPRDCWWQGDRYFSATYTSLPSINHEQEGLSEIVCGLFLPPSQPTHKLQPSDYPSQELMRGCFGGSGRSPAFQACFSKFNPDAWDWSDHIDLSQEFGLELYFDKKRLASDGDPVFVGVNLKRDRLGPSTAWLGSLPLGLQWDNAIDEAIKLIGRQPDEQELDFDVWGWAKWFLDDHLLWINFDTIRNRLESIALMDLAYEKT
jgi:hypothetical protein